METSLIETQYRRAKTNLLNDESICKQNRELFTRFFEHEEHKLKRTNGLPKLDEGTYRTLYQYILRFKNTNKWFKNKPLKSITRDDIKRVYDGLEDGDIKNDHGQPFKARKDYYNKVFRSKLFELAGKADLAREVIQFTMKSDSEVRFVTEEDFRKIVNTTPNKLHKLLLWLAFDYGENINALLQVRKSDFHRQINPDTKDAEYRLNFRKEILKRTRTNRSEINNYLETADLLEELLSTYEDDEQYIFSFDYRNAKKILDRLVQKTKVRCIPKGQKVTWKDLRSGMACDLLKKDWTRDEINARLGHRPSSAEIDKYVNFLAIDRHAPKKKVLDNKLAQVNKELEETRERERRYSRRAQEMEEELKSLRDDLNTLKRLTTEEFKKEFKRKLRQEVNV